MAFTQADLDALTRAFLSRATRVTYDGKTVEFRTLEELMQAIDIVSAALGVSNPLTPAAAATGESRFSLGVLRRMS